MPVTYPVKIQVWAAAGGHCCKCKKYLIKNLQGSTDKSNQGEVAHIEGEKVGAKRWNKNQSEKDRNSFANLMLVCPNDHTEIDSDDVKYTVEVLKKIKSDHETWLRRKIESASFNISFAELEVVLKYLTSKYVDANLKTDYNIIPPSDKISKNNLSELVGTYITMGMLNTDLVRSYLNRNPDVNFADRLRKGFVEKYTELKKDSNSDELFFQLLDFASGASIDFPNQAAALTVLVYFFVVCDVFES